MCPERAPARIIRPTMTLDELQARCEEVRKEWAQASASAHDPAAVEALRVRFLGRKGSVTAVFDALRTLPPDARAAAGKLLNALKGEIAAALEVRQAEVEREAVGARLAAERYDFTLPGKWRPVGRLHPLTQVRREIEDIFLKLGFDVASGPEVETDYYNFEALAIGADHPARDDWDSFYIEEGRLLRTHTSPVQIRVMKSRRPPVRIVCPGRCYRRDNPDATHSPVFHQIELLWVDKGLTMAHLKWILGEFVQAFFGPGYEMRISADFFPFTEPSAQVHIRKPPGKWLEIMGAGMVDPAVLTEVGYDPEEVTGFAFGLGVERMAMLRWGIDDIRLFYGNDVRFLSQF
ncbi:MAG: Phenylalanyl-tRNA synthetase alpha chain [Candidatus Bipolaricaulis sibiricus]|uniref:Phenylalanine--tRNA ligase alpha subunit n=1 Tax=Bipolaricaulis sibiricus TaxID=2501609 RepID=A0A410FV72_BIPS1|nr:MAG: Phenylalanyl-tRNA synthetase alpha chain [Candidatus Bipolaricaulis sibiricus]